METEHKRPNWFVRILIILLCLFIGGIIAYNFLKTNPQAQITSGLIILVAFLTVLVLSEAFDNFSILKLISLSRAVKEKEVNNQELKKENTELRNQLITFTANISQRQVNSTFVMTDELARTFTVKQADGPEKEEEENAEERIRFRKYISFSKFEEIAMPRFLQNEGLGQLPIIRDAKLVSHFRQVDPVSEYSPIFDGYIKTVDAEIFIEMKSKRIGSSIRERLYIMLSKINYYRSIKKVNAFLYLVLITRPDDEESDRNAADRVLLEFEPAIANGLLQIRTIEISKQEYESILKSEQ